MLAFLQSQDSVSDRRRWRDWFDRLTGRAPRATRAESAARSAACKAAALAQSERERESARNRASLWVGWPGQ